MIESYLKSVPDVVFMQDSIDYEDISVVLDRVSDKKYKSFFRNQNVADKDGKQRGCKEGTDEHEHEDQDDNRSITGIAWNKEKYIGTPLQVSDAR